MRYMMDLFIENRTPPLNFIEVKNELFRLVPKNYRSHPKAWHRLGITNEISQSYTEDRMGGLHNPTWFFICDDLSRYISLLKFPNGFTDHVIKHKLFFISEFNIDIDKNSVELVSM